jgi:hypothetical protein
MSMTDYYAGPPLTQTGLLAMPMPPDPSLIAAAPAAAPAQLDPTLAFDLNDVAPQHADFTQGQITGQANAPLPGIPPADVSGPGGTTGAVDSILAQAPPTPVNPLSTPEGLAAFNAKFLAENPQPADPNEVKGKGEKGLFANPQYSTKQKWLMGLSGLQDIAASLVGKTTNNFDTAAAGYTAANKATYDEAIAEHNRAYMQAFAEADPDISPLDKAFFRTADTATLNKALGTHLEAFSLPGGDSRYPGPGAAPIIAPKFGAADGNVFKQNPDGSVSITTLPPSSKEAAQVQLDQAHIALYQAQADYERNRGPMELKQLQIAQQRADAATSEAITARGRLNGENVSPSKILGRIMTQVQQRGRASLTPFDEETLKLYENNKVLGTASGQLDAATGLIGGDLNDDSGLGLGGKKPGNVPAPAAGPPAAPRAPSGPMFSPVLAPLLGGQAPPRRAPPTAAAPAPQRTVAPVVTRAPPVAAPPAVAAAPPVSPYVPPGIDTLTGSALATAQDAASRNAPPSPAAVLQMNQSPGVSFQLGNGTHWMVARPGAQPQRVG